MNPSTHEEAKRIFTSYKKSAAKLARTTIVACPPFVYVPLVSPTKGSTRSAQKVSAGAQDVFYEEEGAFTGQVSAKMLRDIGVSYVIIGHSERRRAGETDEIVSKKAIAAVTAGLCPIICIGEAVHDADGAYMETLKLQIKTSLAGLPISAAEKLVIAYEPLWAIGAKEAMKPEDVGQMAIFIKKIVADIFGQEAAFNLRVLYGGSVNWRNAIEIIQKGGVDGLLVGRESVNISGFAELAKAVDMA
jgi:triosephosphate isomerase